MSSMNSSGAASILDADPYKTIEGNLGWMSAREIEGFKTMQQKGLDSLRNSSSKSLIKSNHLSVKVQENLAHIRSQGLEPAGLYLGHTEVAQLMDDPYAHSKIVGKRAPSYMGFRVYRVQETSHYCTTCK